MEQDILRRARNEKELYNKGINRKRYNAHFGRANWGQGYADIREKNIVSGVLKKGRMFWNWGVPVGTLLLIFIIMHQTT